MSFGRRLVALLVAIAASGCVFYVGTSAQSPHGLQDLRYGKGASELLRPGTTREEIVTRFGVPDRVLDGGRTILYVAPVESGQLWVVAASPAGQVGGAGVPMGRSVALAITFDDDGRYARHRMEIAGLGEPHAAAQRALQPAK